MSLEHDIKCEAIRLGFDAAGITDAGPIAGEHVRYLRDWLDAGYAGRMSYMHRNFEKRTNPAGLCDDAQSVIVLALNYKPPPREAKAQDVSAATGAIARYAQYEDYHPFIKKKLRKLTEFIAAGAGAEIRFKSCVDSVPLAERALAVRAGIGFIGRNHMLISPELGPEIFLAEIITSLKLKPDAPNADGCSDCSKCVEACPTGALRSDGRFDAAKCISYLTIEHKASIPQDQAAMVGDRLFGCDQCVLACPYQQDAPTCANKAFKFYPETARLDLHDVLNMTPESFQTKFAHSPIHRPGLEVLKRNARICLQNGGERCDGCP